jgi:NADPH-dependent curcumin reductase CurA
MQFAARLSRSCENLITAKAFANNSSVYLQLQDLSVARNFTMLKSTAKMVRNNTVIYRFAPDVGSPLTPHNLAIEDRSFELDAEPPNGGFTMVNLFFSLDPGLRLRMVSSDDQFYTAPFKVGQPLEETCISRVLRSSCASLKPGDLVIGSTPMEEYSTIPPEKIGLHRIMENPHFLPLTNFLGPLGIPGLTAYASLFAIGKPQPGETLYVSAAAGGVGQVVGQLAKIAGLTVIGSVGTDEKLDIVKNVLCFDDAFNYNKENAADALRRLAPEGIDIYFDNVAGEALDAALVNMKRNGRISKCSIAARKELSLTNVQLHVAASLSTARRERRSTVSQTCWKSQREG